MIKFMRSAVVVVACVFAGVGAWGAKVEVDTVYTYASELFGEGHAAIEYPAAPYVVLTIPGNTATANTGSTHEGSAEVTFTLLGGATFDANVGGLMWDNDLEADGPDIDPDEDGDPATEDADDANPATGNTANDFVTAPGTVASIMSGGRKGDSSITIKVEPAGSEATANAATRRNYEDGTAAPGQSIAFMLPSLSNLDGSLKDASKAKTMVNQVSLRAEARLISGAFSNTFLTGSQLNGFTAPVVRSRDAVTLSVEGTGMKNIVIKGDNAFKAVKEANATSGYVELATVTVSTRTEHVVTPESETKAESVYRLQSTVADGALAPTPATDGHIYKAAKSQTKVAHTLLGLDGEMIDAGLRGVLTVDAMGTRDLFNEDDMLFIDYDGDKKMGGSEGIALDGDMGMGDALSIDPDNSDSFKGGTGAFKVYYMPGGKMSINHGAMIKLTAMVDYSDPSATDEAAKSASTEFRFEGVTSEVMAYAIPFDGNGKGDKANVRVRCEAAAGCRVFLECWDDMGMRSFGEAGMIGGNALTTWSSMDVEGVIGIEEATSRHSCRILSAGMVTVQQLTRDGTSGTLVNNTYVGE